MATETDKEFLEFLVKSIVDHPEDVKIDRKVDEMGVLLTLLVNPKDMGQVVGRGGSTAKAIRSLLRIVGIKHNARVNLKIEEPEGSERRESGASKREEAKTEEDEPKQTGSTTTVDQVIDDIKNGL
jgi:hypothetical protein